MLKRILALIAVAAVVVTPTVAGGRATHHVVVAGHLRVLLPVGYENRLPFARSPGVAPNIVYSATVQLSDTPDFSRILDTKTLGGTLFLRDGLPLVVPGYDGVTNFGGTSGFFLLDVFDTRIRTAFETMSDQLYWRLADDSATVNSQGFDTIDPHLGIVDTSQVTVSGL